MNNSVLENAEKIKEYINNHNGIDTVIIDLSDKCSWAECFIISTVTSSGHLKGLVHELWSFLISLGLSVNKRHKTPRTDTWELIDCSDIVIHLMNKETREFYSLERLWEVYTQN